MKISPSPGPPPRSQADYTSAWHVLQVKPGTWHEFAMDSSQEAEKLARSLRGSRQFIVDARQVGQVVHARLQGRRRGPEGAEEEVDG